MDKELFINGEYIWVGNTTRIYIDFMFPFLLVYLSCIYGITDFSYIVFYQAPHWC